MCWKTICISFFVGYCSWSLPIFPLNSWLFSYWFIAVFYILRTRTSDSCPLRLFLLSLTISYSSYISPSSLSLPPVSSVTFLYVYFILFMWIKKKDENQACEEVYFEYPGLPCGSDGKHLSTMWETWVRSLGWEDSLGNEMATHSSTSCHENPVDGGAWCRLLSREYIFNNIWSQKGPLYACLVALAVSDSLWPSLWTAARQAPLSTGFSRQEYWSGLPCLPPGNLPDPGIETASLTSPALTSRFFTTSTTWEAPEGPLLGNYISIERLLWNRSTTEKANLWLLERKGINSEVDIKIYTLLYIK